MAYSTAHELAARLLSSLQTQNGIGGTTVNVSFDLRPQMRESSNQSSQPLPSSPWGGIPSSAFLAAAAAAATAFSMKATAAAAISTTTTSTTTNGSANNGDLRATVTSLHRPAVGTEFFSGTGRFLNDFSNQPSHNSDNDPLAQAHRLVRNPRPSERGRRSRVVIHQFGDAEDHFSKALRNLHVKSVGEGEIPESAEAKKRVWTLTSSFDSCGSRYDSTSAIPSIEAQNIADLAVEKHFEKSLASFRAKKAAEDAASAATPVSVEDKSKHTLDLSPPHHQQAFSPSSSTNSNSDGSIILAIREEGSGPSFNPKKKWLAQYGGDEGAHAQNKHISGSFSVFGLSWNSSSSSGDPRSSPVSQPTSIEKRSHSCPILNSESIHLSKKPAKDEDAVPTNQTNPKSLLISRPSTSEASSSIASSLQLKTRDLFVIPHTFSLEAPSLGNSAEFFVDDEGEDAVAAYKSISARGSTVSSPMAASSGFFTDSTYSLDSSTLPVISEAVACFGSNISVGSNFKARHLTVLRDGGAYIPQSMCRNGLDSAERSCFVPQERCWHMGKRTASDASDLSCLKRSRSVVDAGSGNHA